MRHDLEAGTTENFHLGRRARSTRRRESLSAQVREALEKNLLQRMASPSTCNEKMAAKIPTTGATHPARQRTRIREQVFCRATSRRWRPSQDAFSKNSPFWRSEEKATGSEKAGAEKSGPTKVHTHTQSAEILTPADFMRPRPDRARTSDFDFSRPSWVWRRTPRANPVQNTMLTSQLRRR